MREDIGITLLYALVRNDSIDAVLGCCQRPLWHIAGTTTEKECLKYTAGTSMLQSGNGVGIIAMQVILCAVIHTCNLILYSIIRLSTQK